MLWIWTKAFAQSALSDKSEVSHVSFLFQKLVNTFMVRIGTLSAEEQHDLDELLQFLVVILDADFLTWQQPAPIGAGFLAFAPFNALVIKNLLK